MTYLGEIVLQNGRKSSLKVEIVEARLIPELARVLFRKGLAERVEQAVDICEHERLVVRGHKDQLQRVVQLPLERPVARRVRVITGALLHRAVSTRSKERIKQMTRDAPRSKPTARARSPQSPGRGAARSSTARGRRA